jgi:hypothetical protein
MVGENMKREEKILLIQCLLKSVRVDYNNPMPRVEKVCDLCMELSNGDDDFNTLCDLCIEYIKACTEYGDPIDGRYFRDEFPRGYENMDRLHNLDVTLYDKSKEFQNVISELVTYPEFIFTDLGF